MPRLKYYNAETNQWEYVSANGAPGKDGVTPEIRIYPAAKTNVSSNTTIHGVCIEGPDIIEEDGTTTSNIGYVYDGLNGKDGKSAYAYAQESGYTGTEKEFAEKLITDIPTVLSNPYPITINGVEYDGTKPVILNIEGVTTSNVELLGETPYKLTADTTSLELHGSGECTYSVISDTVAQFDIMNGTTNNAVVTEENGRYVLAVSGSPTAWYQAYVDMTVSGLTVGEKYNFVFDGVGVIVDNSSYPVGHYILYDGNGGTLVTRGATDSARLNTYEFTANTESVKLRWYPRSASNFSTTEAARVNAIYINRAGTKSLTDVVNLSGTFTDTKTFSDISSGCTITTNPTCEVYAEIDDAGSEARSFKPMYGKKIVCFGDSLFGMYRGDTSAPAYVAEVTGATVYNVGFGGCRMSTHPTSGYAEFSMWALAKAVAENDFTSQDSAVSSGSDYFADQLAILKSINFNAVDAVVIHYGTNDFGGSVDIGADSSASTTTTLCGAMRYSIETLLGTYPNLRIYISLPAFRFWTSNSITTYSDSYTNSQGDTLVDVVEAIRSVAKEYNLPIIDGYYGLGINKVNASTFLSDGTHHNDAGRKRFGSFIGSQINANF